IGLLGTFMLSSREAGLYISMCKRKAADVRLDNGVSRFATDDVQGLVLYGQRTTPQVVSARLWSKGGHVAQDISVWSADAGTSIRCMSDLLASYRVLEEDLPKTGNGLHETIVNELRAQKGTWTLSLNP